MPGMPRSRSKMTLGVTGIRALQSRFRLDHPNVKVLKGIEFGTDYRETFFRAFPQTRDKVWVHHAIERRVLKKYPGLFTEQEIHALENLRGISNDVNRQLHLRELRLVWNQFYREHPSRASYQGAVPPESHGD